MDPNSTHQLWSRWTTTISVPFHAVHKSDAFRQEMRNACARFYRKLFGSASEMKVEFTSHTSTLGSATKGISHFVVDFRTEGAPVPDLVYRQRQKDAIGEFFGKNLRKYGTVQVHIDIFIEAGDTGDGKPPAQLILAPPLVLPQRSVS